MKPDFVAPFSKQDICDQLNWKAGKFQKYYGDLHKIRSTSGTDFYIVSTLGTYDLAEKNLTTEATTARLLLLLERFCRDFTRDCQNGYPSEAVFLDFLKKDKNFQKVDSKRILTKLVTQQYIRRTSSDEADDGKLLKFTKRFKCEKAWLEAIIKIGSK